MQSASKGGSRGRWRRLILRIRFEDRHFETVLTRLLRMRISAVLLEFLFVSATTEGSSISATIGSSEPKRHSRQSAKICYPLRRPT